MSGLPLHGAQSMASSPGCGLLRLYLRRRPVLFANCQPRIRSITGRSTCCWRSCGSFHPAPHATTSAGDQDRTSTSGPSRRTGWRSLVSNRSVLGRRPRTTKEEPAISMIPKEFFPLLKILRGTVGATSDNPFETAVTDETVTSRSVAQERSPEQNRLPRRSKTLAGVVSREGGSAQGLAGPIRLRVPGGHEQCSMWMQPRLLQCPQQGREGSR